MSENMEIIQRDPTTILLSLISPDVAGGVLVLTDGEIAAVFATASEKYGLPESSFRATWRMLVRRISQVTVRKSSPPKKPLKDTPLEKAIKGSKKDVQNSPG